MISYRHHVVTLVAVFLALAVGVVLGGGPLSEVGRAAATTHDDSASRAEVARAAAFGNEFATATAPTLYGGRLAGHPVAVVAMPGADDEQVDALTAQVTAAGGTVTGRFDARGALLDPGEKSLVDTLGSQLMTQAGEGAVDADAPTYARMGQLLGVALASTNPAGEPLGAPAQAVRGSLTAAEMLTSSDESAGRAPLVLVVLGSVSAGQQADPDVLAGLLGGLAARSVGVVVAGDAASGAEGDLAVLRHQPVAESLSTVDGVDTALGQVSAVLALIREIDGSGGSFGASGAEGAVPLG